MRNAKAEYVRKKLTGLCTKKGCNRPQSLTSLLCDRCSVNQKRYRENWEAKQPERYNADRLKVQRGKRALKNKCRRCGSKKLHTAKNCLKCLEYARRLHDEKKSANIIARICSICRTDVPRRHNKLTCPNIGQVEFDRFVKENQAKG